ncbi:MAG: Maf family protein [Rhodospirillales bacterium]|nr:Maf family protein [Rhodospirillales bacterium]
MLQAPTPELVLASGSAARRALLEAAGLRVTIHPASVDEGAIKRACQEGGDPPDIAALRLATAKASDVAAAFPAAMVIGADQLLVCDGVWFDKPGSPEALRAQLRRLRGQRHTLVTAVVVWQAGRAVWSHVAAPTLQMRSFSDTFLETYCQMEGDAVLSCVGGYRLEGPGVHLFAQVDGEHSAILGLPLLPLLAFLRETGVLLG